jgi:hypothetical protein
VPTEEDVNTTPPNPQMADGMGGWKMPEPVFRKTSGYLPQGFEKRFSQDDIRPAADDNDSTAEMPAPELSGDIEPQPDIGETLEPEIAAEPTAAAAAAPAKRSGAKVVLLVLGLLLALGLVVVLAAAVYLFYLMPNPDATF